MSVIPVKIGNLEYSYAEGIGAPHCFTTRLGGVSTGIFDSLNLNFSRGDDPEKVVENFRRIGEVLGFTPEDVVNARQTHSDIVVRVDGRNRDTGGEESASGREQNRDLEWCDLYKK